MADNDGLQITIQNLQRVKTNIENVYGKKAVAAKVLCKKYATLAVKTARENQGLAQGEGQFWTNRTSEAIKGIRGFTDGDADYVGWGLMHTVEYGRWLELANNRRHGILEKTIRVLAPFFMDDVRKIYGK